MISSPHSLGHFEKERNNNISHCLFCLCLVIFCSYWATQWETITTWCLSECRGRVNANPRGAVGSCPQPSCCSLITDKHRLLCYHNIQQGRRQSYNWTGLLTAVVFSFHTACNKLCRDAFPTCLLREVSWVVFCKNSKNPKSPVITLGQHNRISYHILVLLLISMSFQR